MQEVNTYRSKVIGRFNRMLLFVVLLSISFQAHTNPIHQKINESLELIVSEKIENRIKGSQFLLQAPLAFKEKITKEYISESEKMAGNLPQKIDSQTSVESIFIDKNKILISYKVDIEKIDKASLAFENLEQEVKLQAINQLCTMPRSALYMLYGNSINRMYTYSDGSHLFSIKTNWDLCNNRS